MGHGYISSPRHVLGYRVGVWSAHEG